MAFPTNPIYKLEAVLVEGVPAGIMKACGGDRRLSIPKNTENTDYQEYLEWVAAGNTPEAAD
jgi:hypothetical protein